MRKLAVLCAGALILAGPFCASAGAEDLKGRLAVSGKIGIINPAESEVDSPAGRLVVSTDAGLTGSLGFMFGVDSNVAVEMEVSRATFDTSHFGEADVTTISVGAQYRFPERQRMVPYLGGGMDVLINDVGNRYANTTVGVHLAGGIDFLLDRQAAFNIEIKGLESFTADVDGPNGQDGEFDPSNVTATVGVRFFFN